MRIKINGKNAVVKQNLFWGYDLAVFLSPAQMKRLGTFQNDMVQVEWTANNLLLAQVFTVKTAL